MSSWLGDRRVVAVLSVLACLIVYQRIVVPLMPTPLPVLEDAEMSGLDPLPDDTGSLQSSVASQIDLSSEQFDIQNIDLETLSFNQNQARDPFVDKPLKAAPFAEVNVAEVQPVVRKPKAAAPPAPPRPPQLSAIAFAHGNAAAVLDNQIVRAGEALGAFRVETIAPTAVVLSTRSSNSTITLTLKP